MIDLPPPLTPADCDLTDFEFMPVMVRRLLKSETWALGTGDERAAAIALWFESWHQVPAASLPSEDRMLKRLADTEKWSKVKAQALRGWLPCSDGRLYHAVVAEKALEAWIEKLLAAISGASGNSKRWGLDINTDAAMAQLQTAIAMLRKIAPQSKTFKKKAVVAASAGIAPGSPPDSKQPPTKSSPPDSPPDTPPDSPPDSGSDRNRQGQRQGQGSNSEPNGSGGKPPMTPDEIIFGYGVPLLVNAGSADKAARSFLGGLRKGHGDQAVVDALRNCLREKPLQPLEWLAAALPPAGAKTKPNAQEALEAANRAVGERYLAQQEAARAAQ